MSDLTISEALPAELSRIRAAYASWGYDPGAEASDVVLQAERGGQLVGIVRCTSEFGVVMLRGMQVAPEARRQGVGKRLLEAFVMRLEGRECYCIPYVHLLDFYGSQGFKLEATEDAPEFLLDRVERYRTQGLDVVLMRRPAA